MGTPSVFLSASFGPTGSNLNFTGCVVSQSDVRLTCNTVTGASYGHLVIVNVAGQLSTAAGNCA
jgi:carbonic anhydrase